LFLTPPKPARIFAAHEARPPGVNYNYPPRGDVVSITIGYPARPDQLKRGLTFSQSSCSDFMTC